MEKQGRAGTAEQFGKTDETGTAEQFGKTDETETAEQFGKTDGTETTKQTETREDTFRVAELFTSINGEGTRAGQLAVFVRFCGCNLHCSYCDTMWANEQEAACTVLTTAQIVERVKQTGIHNITLTGGEPLLQPQLRALLTALLEQPECRVEIETNGSLPIVPFHSFGERVTLTADYKLPGSGMEEKMELDNLCQLRACDTIKFVAGSWQDLERARELMEQYQLMNRCHVYLSPVFGQIDPAAMVEFMKKYQLNEVNLQIQMHKVIWDPMAKGV